MFDDTLHSSWGERSRRGFSALTSFALQGLAAGTLLLFSLFRPAGLPSFHSLSTPVSLGQPMGEPPAVRTRAGENPAAAPNNPAITLRMPTRIPNEIPSAGDDSLPSVAEFGGPNAGGAVTGDPRGMPNLFGGSQPVLPIATPAARIAPLRVSHISEGNLVRKILPTYPALARSARIQGQVVLQAVISKQGTIENLKVLTGHPMLVPAAIEAVRQWRYRPYILNNEPVEVETQITVNFSLGGN
ncbi:MAG: energy transducer TonB [Candidatus Sulfotelmatobacter sp.]